jgi:hypothetical protein
MPIPVQRVSFRGEIGEEPVCILTYDDRAVWSRIVPLSGISKGMKSHWAIRRREIRMDMAVDGKS